jgi:hypothetical protein
MIRALASYHQHGSTPRDSSGKVRRRNVSNGEFLRAYPACLPFILPFVQSVARATRESGDSTTVATVKDLLRRSKEGCDPRSMKKSRGVGVVVIRVVGVEAERLKG